MAMWRRQRMTSRTGGPGLFAGLLLLTLCLSSAAASTTERVVTDPLTGLAIGGFDPVAYFTDGTPMQGRADLEMRAEGTIWRFRNEGNRAAFAATPHVYRPRFGGYDPMAIGRGVGTAGSPEIWVIFENSLYFFYNAQSREAFTANPHAAISLADEKWAEVLRTLVP